MEHQSAAVILSALCLVAILGTAHAQADAAAPTAGPFEEFQCSQKSFTQKLDHFNKTETRTFQQRYYVCPGAFPTDPTEATNQGNIILFLGNESPLVDIAQPIVFENAARKKALVVEVEHRYYGESMPFQAGPNGLLKTEEYKYLTIEQAIEDTVSVLESVRSELKIDEKVPVVVIGGSYGGDLAAYHRLTYPKTFAAAIASSAPVKYIYGTKSLEDNDQKFHELIGTALTAVTGSSTCADNIRKALDEIDTATNNVTARNDVAAALNICNPVTALDDPSTIPDLLEFMYDPIVGVVQLNDQKTYENYILNVCDIFQSTLTNSSGNYLEALGMIYRSIKGINSTSDCIVFNDEYSYILNPFEDPSSASYSYQCCTQGVVVSQEFSSDGVNGTLLPAINVSEEEVRMECLTAYGGNLTEMEAPDIAVDFMEELENVGKIVFTNGELDGWAGGSILEDIPDVKMATVVYKNASHCTDTHSFNWGNEIEPADYKTQRAEAMDKASEWMEEFRVGSAAVAVRAVSMVVLSAVLFSAMMV